DTIMGRYLRAHWIPCMAEHEVPGPDQPPRRLRLLGEDWVVFRDSEGRVGVLDEHCLHRRASLFFGRNEEGGLRCVYHGWKFAWDGALLDVPNERRSTGIMAKLRARACRAQLRGGLLWVYVGPEDAEPAFPEFEWLDLPDTHRVVSRWEQDCNSVQAMEGELDPSHASFLHRRLDRLAESDSAIDGRYFQEDTSPVLHVDSTDYGFITASQREVDEASAYWRLNQFILPFYTIITTEPDHARMIRMWVPRDDESCWVIALTYRMDEPIRPAEREAWETGVTIHRRIVPGTTRAPENRDNDYLIDREVQSTVSFTGIDGIRAQDAMACESAGAIVDRSLENLVSSDLAIVVMRKRLLQEARKMADGGEQPDTAAKGSLYRVRGHQMVLPRERHYSDDPDAMRAMYG
ncbi:MAG: Rieske 2Fe-2S domain-containing protein, partial [Pigmentiphaga sp.]